MAQGMILTEWNSCHQYNADHHDTAHKKSKGYKTCTVLLRISVGFIEIYITDGK